MLKEAIHKLKSNDGFMLAEQLLSMIFIGLLCVAVGAGMGAAMSAFASISTKTESQALLNQAVQKVSDEFVFSKGDVRGTQYASPSVNGRVQLVNMSAGNNVGIAFRGNGIGTGVVGADEDVLFIPAVDNLVPVISGVAYNSISKTWTFTIDVRQDNATGAVIATSGAMTVLRVGN